MPVNDPDQYYDDGRTPTPDPLIGLPRGLGNVSPHMQMMLPTSPYGLDSGYTSARAAYGDIPMMGAIGAGAVGGGIASGVGGMFSAIGAQIMPVTYTPPAHVLTDYSNRYMQSVGVMSDIKMLLGFGPMMRSAREADLRYNAATDLGERLALGGTGLGLSGIGLGASAIGSAIGGGALGFVGSLAGGLGGFAAAGYATDRIHEGIAARRDIMGFMEATSDRFITASSSVVDPRRGAGLSSAGRLAVADMVRTMDVGDPLLNTGELTKILRESSNLGLFTGTHDIDDFKTKFKTIVDSVKTVTTTLHQTLEEGLKTIRDLRSIGIDPAMAGQVALRSEALGRVAGKSAGEMLNLGLQGAEMFRGTGVGMQIGFESNLMNIASIRAARDAGMLSQEAIAQAGGEESLAQRMTASSLAYSQTAAGRGFSAMYFNPAGGGSGFSQQAFIDQVMAGGGDLTTAAMTAARNLSTPGAMIRFQANQEKILTDMGKMFGGQGLAIRADAEAMMQATALANLTGASTEDAFRMILKQQGKSAFEVDAEIAKIRNAPGAFAAAQSSAETTRQVAAQQGAAQNFFVNRWQAQLGDLVTGAADVVAQPANRAIESVSQGAADFSDYMVGTQRVNLDGSGYEAQIVNDPAGAATRRLGRAVNLDRGGVLGMNAGEDLAMLIKKGGMGPFAFAGGGNITLQRGGAGMGKDFTVSLADLDANAKLARLTGRTIALAQEADVGGALKNEREAARAALIRLQGSATLEGVTDIGGLAQAVYGTGLGGISQGQYDALLLETQNSPKFTQMAEAARRGGEAILAARNAVSVANEAGDLAAANSAKDNIIGILGGSASALSGSAIARLADINRIAISGSDAGLEQAKLAFKGELRKIEGDEGDRLRGRSDEFIDRALSGDPGLTRQFSAFSSNFRSLSEEQQRRGHEILTRAVEVDIFGLSKSLTTEDEKKKIINIMDRIGAEGVAAVQGLGKDDLSILAKTAAGGMISQEASIISRIESLKPGTSSAGMREALSGMVAPKQLEGITNAYESGQSKAAIEMVHAQTMDSLAGRSNVAAAGATAGVGVSGTATAEQNFAVQTSMNMQILQALTALSAKLGVK